MRSKQRAISAVLFLLLISVLFVGIFKVLKLKAVDGTYSLTKFYEQREDSVDIIFLGSSHAYENISTQVMWDDYGFATYDLGGSIQPPWNTYYYLKEALKTQRPKLIVYDVYAATIDGEYSDTARAMKNTYGMRFSFDKLAAVEVSFEHRDIYGLMDYLLEFPTYHSRYSELEESDFTNKGRDYGPEGQGRFQCDDWKGFYLNTGHTELAPFVIPQIEQTLPLEPKAAECFEKIVELTRQEGIPLLLVSSPYQTSETDAMRLRTIEDYARQNNIPFNDYTLSYNELNLDFGTDYADGGHFNEKGSAKYTNKLGEYINNNYDIPDHRGEAAYSDYDRMAEWYRNAIAEIER